ncbi:MAG: hypothetical protein GY946_10535 [bacterium]|nr:hypothetical protein [bacterium]
MSERLSGAPEGAMARWQSALDSTPAPYRDRGAVSIALALAESYAEEGLYDFAEELLDKVDSTDHELQIVHLRNQIATLSGAPFDSVPSVASATDSADQDSPTRRLALLLDARRAFIDEEWDVALDAYSDAFDEMSPLMISFVSDLEKYAFLLYQQGRPHEAEPVYRLCIGELWRKLDRERDIRELRNSTLKEIERVARHYSLLISGILTLEPATK